MLSGRQQQTTFQSCSHSVIRFLNWIAKTDLYIINGLHVFVGPINNTSLSCGFIIPFFQSMWITLLQSSSTPTVAFLNRTRLTVSLPTYIVSLGQLWTQAIPPNQLVLIRMRQGTFLGRWFQRCTQCGSLGVQIRERA